MNVLSLLNLMLEVEVVCEVSKLTQFDKKLLLFNHKTNDVLQNKLIIDSMQLSDSQNLVNFVQP